MVIGLFLFFPLEVRICIYWIFQRRKRHKNYRSIESAHLANTVNFPQLPVTEPSMPAGAQSESRAQSPDASERKALWSDEPSFIPLTSYIGNRWGKSHCISQPPRPPDGEETSLLSFFTIFIWIPPPQQSTINVAQWHFKVCYRHFKGASWASRTAFIRVVQVPLFAHAALCYSLVN